MANKKLWVTSFHRINMGFTPMLEQKADVIFETEVPFQSEHIDEFLDAAEKAMWEQNPHWKDSSSPMEGGVEWSPVQGGHQYQEIERT